MALAPGTLLGPYEIDSALGAGGMGEVYRATDTNLKRQVAIKVLPDAVATDSERLARFQREAEVLASLNHPNIAAIHGLERADGQTALVMELVEGPTLADRIAQGPIPIEEALPIARQMAEALEAAHERGIIHRDLKPANIKVRPDGTVKVLDFGLAKAMEPSVVTAAGVSLSPTITSPAMTMAGVILGTAAYMSPEQARGKVVDKRADIWAFGCVLYEMLTGQGAFGGEDVTVTLARVVEREPNLDALPPAIPARVRQVLGLCLRKDPKQRVSDIRDVRLALDGAFESVAPPTTATAAASTHGRHAWMAAFAVAVVGMIALGVPALRHVREMPPEEPSLQLSVPLPTNSTPRFLEMSPDGRRLLVSVFQDGRTRLYVRSLDSPEWQPLSGADAARTPFWSPDSRFIGFFGDGALQVIPAAGGPARELCSETGTGQGGTWNPSGVILFGSDSGPLRRVDAKGGTCAVVGKDDLGSSARLPDFLPDGNHFFYVGVPRGDPASRGVYLAALDDFTPRKILADYSGVVYAPPLAGGRAHLMFLRDTTLMAQPFDDATLEAVGDPFPVASRAATTMTGPQVAASVSNGTLVYLAGRSRETQLTWFDRSGKELGTAGPRAQHVGVVLSPDGNAVLTSRTESNGQSALWLYDLARGSESRFLPPGTQYGRPAWFPDSRRVLFRMTPVPAESGLVPSGRERGRPAGIAGADCSRRRVRAFCVLGGRTVPGVYRRRSQDTGRHLVYAVGRQAGLGQGGEIRGDRRNRESRAGVAEREVDRICIGRDRRVSSVHPAVSRWPGEAESVGGERY